VRSKSIAISIGYTPDTFRKKIKHDGFYVGLSSIATFGYLDILWDEYHLLRRLLIRGVV